MKIVRGVRQMVAVIMLISWWPSVCAGKLRFQHHFIARDLPISEKGVGDYGLTALVDLDGDRDLDFVLGGRSSSPSQLYWFEYLSPDRRVRHCVGTNYLSDAGLAPLDVDRDGWVDLICSGVWYPTPFSASVHWFIGVGSRLVGPPVPRRLDIGHGRLAFREALGPKLSYLSGDEPGASPDSHPRRGQQPAQSF